ncbi:hypothetical protein [Paenibacillus elgii]|uniref:hypothetical protein n=1 Tax=Paenibacillus elgii TaxID=189691 RepID=UPI0013D34045|nr:hypothetical protein [Paenibacillus elgii]
MSCGFQGQRLKKVFAILLCAVCFTGLGTREALAYPLDTRWDCSDKLYYCQAADLVPGLSFYQNTTTLYVPEGTLISYHYKDTRAEKPFDDSYTKISLSYHDDKGQDKYVAYHEVRRRGGEAGGEVIAAPKSNGYYLTIECWSWNEGNECSGSGYVRTLK